MADILKHLLYKEDTTVQEIESFLKSQNNISSIINQETDFGFPLHIAVHRRKPLDIIEILLKNGAEVNQTMRGFRVPLQQVWFSSMEGCETLCYETVKMLLKYGADVKGVNHSIGPLIDFVQSNDALRSKIFIPIFRMLLQHADNPTKSEALENLIMRILRYPYAEEDKLENSIEAVRVLLESGVFPAHQFVVFFFNRAHFNIVKRYTKRKSQHVFSLFTVVLPYFMLSSSEAQQRDSTRIIHSDHSRFIADMRNTYYSRDIAEMLDSLLRVWDDCAEQCNEMRMDMFTHDSSTLQVLRHSRGTESDPVTSQAAYGLLQRIARGQYPHFRDIMSTIVKYSNVMDLYMLTYRERFRNAYVMHPDSFYGIKQYLTGDDVFNFLLALNS